MRKPLALALTAAGLALFCPHAGADAASGLRLAGHWRFETAPISPSCKLSGEMQVSPTSDPKRFICRIVSLQACAGEPKIEIRMSQTCQASISGDAIEIVSKVEKAIKVTPEALGVNILQRYAPDDFSVVATVRKDELTGMFHSLARAKVRFWRDADLVS